MKLVGPTLEARVMKPRRSRRRDGRRFQNMCMDRGYDYEEVEDLVEEFGYTAHIRRRGEEIEAKRRNPRHRARRWVVERTHSWINRFRRLLIRWEKLEANYLGLLQFACALITYRAAGVFG
jgi:transposase